jgi:hypothetical protein
MSKLGNEGDPSAYDAFASPALVDVRVDVSFISDSHPVGSEAMKIPGQTVELCWKSVRTGTYSPLRSAAQVVSQTLVTSGAA